MEEPIESARILPTAEEARRATDASVVTATNEVLRRVACLIEEACADGANRITILASSADRLAIAHLEAKGYGVERNVDPRDNTTSYTITW